MDWQRILGVGADADAAELKRAYARLLKSNRPDDDPAAFQRIQSAFETGLTHLKRRALAAYAEAEDDDWAEPEEWPEAFEPDAAATAAGEEDIALPWHAGAATRETPGEFAATLPPRERDEADALVDEILALSLAGKVEALQAWLDAREELYSLDLKLEVSRRLLWRLPAHEDGIGWRIGEAVFRFFEIDGVADPRLGENPAAYALWQRVRADERFEHAKQRMRALHYTSYTDKLVDRELFGAPGAARRRRFMWLNPWAGKQLRARYEELRALDPVRVETAFAAGVLDYWLPVTNLERLHWRRALPAVLAIGAATLLLALLFSANNFSAAAFFGLWGVFAAIGLGGWGAWTLFFVAVRGYWSWRDARFGPGPAPAGAPLLADAYSVFWLGCDLLLLSLAAAFRLFGWPYWVLTLVCAAYFFAWVGRVQLWPHKRWEELAFLALAIALLLPVTGWLFGEDSTQPVVLASSALASSGLILFDYLHALLAGRPLVEVRESFGWPICIAAAALAAGAWFYRF
jgi:hypothetical protein